MSTILGVDNSIGWAHWRLRGAWKNTFITVASYAFVIVGLILLTVRMSDPRGVPADVLANWRIILMLLQYGILLLYSCSRIAVAVRGDITSRMIESHRLMPVSPYTAISGYIWGPASQGLALAVVNFLIGLGVTQQSGMELGVWALPNLGLAIFAAFLFVVAAFSAFASRAGWGVAFGAILLLGFSQGMLVEMFPPMSVLCKPLLGGSIFQARTPSYELNWPEAVSFLSLVAIGAVLYCGAARKYRRSEDTSLAVVPAMILLLVWMAMGTIGLRWRSDFFRVRSYDPVKFLPLFIATIGSGMILAPAAVANAGRDRRWAPYSPLVALFCAALICMPGVVMRAEGDHTVPLISATCAIVAAYLIGVLFLLRIMYRVGQRGWFIATIWTAMIWFVPVIADAGAWALSDTRHDFVPGSLSTLSPVGALSILWGDEPLALWPGVLFQCGCAVAWAAVFYLTRRRRTA